MDDAGQSGLPEEARHSSQPGSSRRDRTVALWCGALALTMIAASFAAVPLYQMFCQVTGYGGTPQRAAGPSSAAIERKITVRFDANVRQLAWQFEPVQRTVDVQLGENNLAFYRATNISAVPLKGTATFNVTPEIAGAHFNKIECFCFQEQTLEPGESVEMPVSFFVAPELADDKDARHLTQITLSYTFYPSNAETNAVAAPAPGPAAGAGG